MSPHRDSCLMIHVWQSIEKKNKTGQIPRAVVDAKQTPSLALNTKAGLRCRCSQTRSVRHGFSTSISMGRGPCNPFIHSLVHSNQWPIFSIDTKHPHPRHTQSPLHLLLVPGVYLGYQKFLQNLRGDSKAIARSRSEEKPQAETWRWPKWPQHLTLSGTSGPRAASGAAFKALLSLQQSQHHIPLHIFKLHKQNRNLHYCRQ